ncbi:hypothetical protein IBX73_03865 [candidate division WOR-3 bacterium]|nr:hypothetical protein [candidate division WOR-3 bacterium]
MKHFKIITKLGQGLPIKACLVADACVNADQASCPTYDMCGADYHGGCYVYDYCNVDMNCGQGDYCHDYGCYIDRCDYDYDNCGADAYQG